MFGKRPDGRVVKSVEPLQMIMPYIMMLGTVGFMMGTGGTALISKTLGMGDRKKANEIF